MPPRCIAVRVPVAVLVVGGAGARGACSPIGERLAALAGVTEPVSGTEPTTAKSKLDRQQPVMRSRGRWAPRSRGPATPGHACHRRTQACLPGSAVKRGPKRFTPRRFPSWWLSASLLAGAFTVKSMRAPFDRLATPIANTIRLELVRSEHQRQRNNDHLPIRRLRVRRVRGSRQENGGSVSTTVTASGRPPARSTTTTPAPTTRPTRSWNAATGRI